MEELVSFPSGQVNYLYDSSVEAVWQLAAGRDVIFITDSNIFNLYPGVFTGKKSIVFPAGEIAKTLFLIQHTIEELVRLEATRKTLLVAIGGGVVTDIAGFVASVYMRGVAFGFVPTSMLGMVDAAIGGKNGVNIGLHKNMAGTITQPEFILYDANFLKTLPADEWSNGFAEIIKYACIFDAPLFTELEQHDIAHYQQNIPAMQAIIKKCVQWKNDTVVNDEHEKGPRKLLNFGHTAGHAIETIYEISHGKAVAVGMVIAAKLSETITSLPPTATEQIKKVLTQYDLPYSYPIDADKVMNLLKMDKKRNGNAVDYILLDAIGKAVIHPLAFVTLEKTISACAQL